MQELTQVNYRYTFPSLTVTNIKVPEGLYTHDFRGNKLVLRVDKFGEVRVANETPCNNERKLAQEINKAAHLISGFKAIVAIDDTFPYFHVTDYPKPPSRQYTYLGIKGREYSTDTFSWDTKKYYYSAKLKSGTKLLDLSKWNAEYFKHAFHKLGLDESRWRAFVEEESGHADIKFYKSLIDEGHYKNLDALIAKNPHYGFHILMDFAANLPKSKIAGMGRNKFFEIFKEQGYKGLYDKNGDCLYEGTDMDEEPQILIFDPKDIVWGEREKNKLVSFQNQVMAKYLIKIKFTNKQENPMV